MRKSFLRRHWLAFAITFGAAIIIIITIFAKRESDAERARKKLIWGDEAMASFHYEEAIDFYEKAVELDPDLIQARYNLAIAYESVDKERAIELWEEYVALASDDPSQSRWIEQAEEHLRRLRAEPLMEAGYAAMEEGDLDTALSKFEEALVVDDSVLDVYYRMAQIYTEQGKYEEAAESYTKALELAPYSLKYRYELALVYEEFDRVKAVETWEDFVERAEGSRSIEREKVVEGKKRLTRLRGGG
ncbi:MAG: tetratricopeptide repeat protein [Candidatus Coatesbacteria bacterium]|nr:MAG: tetratricopeptide repeat protein [Candidatus Coatesbacteria bacterium]